MSVRENHVEVPLKLKKKIQPLCEAASPFLGTYLKNIIYQRDMHSHRFNVGASAIAMKLRVSQWIGR